MRDYCRLFDKSFLVIPEMEYERYKDLVDENVGVILLCYQSGRIVLRTKKEAQINPSIDVNLLMSCCRTSEYESFILRHFGFLPHVPPRHMYPACCELMSSLSTDELKRFFMATMKSRKADLEELRPLPKCIRQMCLSLNLRGKQTDLLLDKLNVIIG